MINERRRAPYAPRVRSPYAPANGIDVLTVLAIGLVAAVALQIAIQAIQ